MTDSLTQNQVAEIAEVAARKAIEELLLALGVDARNPEALLELREDFRHTRLWRRSTEAVRGIALKTAVTVIVTGALGWLGVAIFKQGQ